MNSVLQETNKRPGVYYALTEDGIELPIVDVTHPSFALKLNDSEVQALVSAFLQSRCRSTSCPSLSATAS